MKNVFIDESGNPNLNYEIQNIGRWYVLVSVIVDPSELDSLNEKLKHIVKVKCGGTEMKSSNISDNHKRRNILLRELASLNFKYYALIVDKALIRKVSGLKWKKSFYKYIGGLMYSKILKAFPQVSIVADEIGRSEFMTSFKKYIQENYQPTIFTEQSFVFKNSRVEPAIQLADMISGSLYKAMENKNAGIDMSILDEKKIIIEYWPPKFNENISGSNFWSEGEKYDLMIERYCYSIATEFILNNMNVDKWQLRCGVEILRFLLSEQQDPRVQYIHADVVMRYLKSYKFPVKSKVTFMNIIAKLRDKNIILSTCESGYRIPTSVSDMRQYVDTVKGKTVPYVERLHKARQQILLASSNELDIVPKDGYPELGKMIGAFS